MAKINPLGIEILMTATRLEEQGSLREAIALYSEGYARGVESEELLLRWGVACARTAELDEAIRIFSLAIQSYPVSIDGHYNLGVSLQQSGRADDALVQYQWVIDHDPGHSGALINLANLLRAKGDRQQAEQRYRQALRNPQAAVDALFNLATLVQELGRHEEAASCLQQAYEKGNRHPEVLFRWAVAHQMTGDLPRAVGLFRELLKQQPDRSEARLNCAICLLQLSRAGEALEVVRPLWMSAAGVSAVWVVSARIALALGQTIEAERYLESALGSLSDDPQPIMDVAVLCIDLMRLEKAIELLDRLLQIDVNNAYVLTARGNALKGLGRIEDAIGCYRRALAADRTNFAAQYNLGVLLAELKQNAEAVAAFESAIKLNPRAAEPHFNLGVVLERLEKLAEAVYHYQQAHEIQPTYSEAWINHGVTLQKLNRQVEALAVLNTAISLVPSSAEAHMSLGIVQQALLRFEEALRSYESAISFKPDFAEAHLNRGVILHKLRKIDSALNSYQTAVDVKPEWAQAHYNLGCLRQELKNYDLARVSYEKAISLQPDYAEAHLNLAFVSLIHWDFTRGWAEYEWRFLTEEHKEKGAPKRPDIREFDGDFSAVKSLIVVSEQGHGDTIQFCRFVTRLTSMGIRVQLVVQQRLVRLIDSLAGAERVCGEYLDQYRYDAFVYLMSLPHFLKTTVDDIPLRSTRYLTPPADLIGEWDVLLGPPDPLRVGIVWSSGVQSKIVGRSVALADLVRALPEGIRYISLQKECSVRELELLGKHGSISHFGDEQDDFADAAAMIENVDLVITVDTAIAHLAGSMNKEVWILLPFNADWRWSEDRADSPWYSSARLIRQSASDQGWSRVLDSVRIDLENRRDSSRRTS
jgi:tetratricopeptide (TPR) repeat protein